MTRYTRSLAAALEVVSRLADLQPALEEAAECVWECLSTGHKLLICGNGGSACDSQHLAGELVGRYLGERRALPAIALSSDGAVVSCIANDYRFEDVFARQIEALGSPGDLLVVFTSSGNSPNICEALRAAKSAGIRSVAFLGRDGGSALGLCDLPLLVPNPATARVQEAHQFLLHALMDEIEAKLASSPASPHQPNPADRT
jgi:D-sedoheptulose 7-phosphate isomerase